MEFRFGVVNTIATAVIILITVLNIVVYKLRQILEANLNRATSEQHLHENSSSLSSSLRSEQLCLCRHFPLGEILLATNNFDDTLVIGQGGFGKVYKGVIDDGAVTVAIKRLNPISKQGAPQFWTEVELLSRFRHSHLVSLIGYCNNRNEMILVYEYMPRGSLADHLYKTRSNGSTNLTWIQRLKICIGAGQGLDYLHTGTGINDRVIHRDMKSSNILLDDSWAAKVSDFGLSKIGPANQNLTHVSTNVKGTFGYFDPEYMTTHRLTRKSDVYSFGVVLLEVLSGKRAMDPKVCEEHWDLAGWGKECIRRKEVDEIIDPYLKHEILTNSLNEFVKIVEKCLHNRSKKRPTMAEVVTSLESALALQERTDSSMLEEDFMNLGWTTSDNQENPDDSTVQGEQVNKVLSGDATNSQSRVKRPRIMPFKRIARFFFGKSRVDSASNMEAAQYDFDTVKAATDNFSLKLGQGSGPVVAYYKGLLPNGQEIAVKKFCCDFSKAESEFRNEISLVAKLHHRNLVRLLGFCSKGTERLLIYEFFPNSSLDKFIYDPPALLDWEQCIKIIRGVSRGIIYLHEDSPDRIIYGGLNPRHILLDSEMNPKISDFGLAISLVGEESRRSVGIIRGTIGYIAPECFHAYPYRVSLKSDVFSFGVLVLEIISGRKAYSCISEAEYCNLLQIYAMRNWWEGIYLDIVIGPHLRLSSSEVTEEIKRCIHIALLCIQHDEVERPTMSSVLLMLNNPSLPLPEPSIRIYSSVNDIQYYDFDIVKAATDNFSRKLGQGGPVVKYYKGLLPNGQEIAVKKFCCEFSQAESEYRNEISLVGKLQHRNLVRLLGFCSKGTERLLIYEFVPNSSLDNFIYNHHNMRGSLLDWEQCSKIIRGVTRGIIYLHDDLPEQIICYGLNSRHILLDSEMNPKIYDFGLVEGEVRVHTFRFSVKSDVFSFGVLVLEIISGRRAYSYISDPADCNLLQIYAMKNWQDGRYWDILIGPHLRLSSSEDIQEIKKFIHIALLCIQHNEVERPTMSSVLLMLDNPSFIDDMLNYNVSFNEDSSFELSPR